MATPETRAQEPPEPPPHLVVISGGLAVSEEVEIKPVAKPKESEAFANIMANLNKDNWANMTAEELLEVRSIISAYMGKVAEEISDLTVEHGKALSEILWINGFIRDRL
jgi:hypothetical protein